MHVVYDWSCICMYFPILDIAEQCDIIFLRHIIQGLTHPPSKQKLIYVLVVRSIYIYGIKSIYMFISTTYVSLVVYTVLNVIISICFTSLDTAPPNMLMTRVASRKQCWQIVPSTGLYIYIVFSTVLSSLEDRDQDIVRNRSSFLRVSFYVLLYCTVCKGFSIKFPGSPPFSTALSVFCTVQDYFVRVSILFQTFTCSITSITTSTYGGQENDWLFRRPSSRESEYS